MTLTVEQLAKLLPKNLNVSRWLTPLNENLEPAGINTRLRLAAFMAQCSHESLDFTHLAENLDYRAASLIATWPRYFNNQNAATYAHHPEAIANRAYANRLGNGDEESRDGWRYRGRGVIQITGKNNYQSCSSEMFNDDRLLDNPDLLALDPDAAIKSAVWYWTTTNLNSLADHGNIKEITKRINGGYTGLEDRTARYERALRIITDE